MAAAPRDTSTTSSAAGSRHRAQHPPPWRRERFGCGDVLRSSVRGRRSAWSEMVLLGGGAPAPSIFAATASSASSACPDSDKRPSRTRKRRRASPKPWRTDSTRAVNRASPRTEHGSGATCATPSPQQKARQASGALHSRAPSSRPCRATPSAPIKAAPANIGPSSGCHCAPTNSPLNHAAAIHGSTKPRRARRVPATNPTEKGSAAVACWRPSAREWRPANELGR